MDEEISKQEEARRLLDTIRHKEEAGDDEERVPAKPISHIAEEDADQLKALIAHKWQLKNESSPEVEELPDPENIDPMSAEQIKGLRKVAIVQGEEKRTLKESLIDSIIKGYFQVADSFKTNSENKRSCFKRGHECIHCGKNIPFAAIEDYEKASKERAAEANTTGAALEKK